MIILDIIVLFFLTSLLSTRLIEQFDASKHDISFACGFGAMFTYLITRFFIF